MTYYYNGFDIKKEAYSYRIVGLPYYFKTMLAVKAHIDWMKRDKHSKIPPFVSKIN